LRKVFIVILVCLVVSFTAANSQTRRRSPSKSGSRVTKAAADKNAAEMKAGRERVAAQIKSLTHFLYLLGGIAKGIEAAELTAHSNQASPVAIQQNERTKARIRDSLKTVREGLDKLESDFLYNPALKVYYPYLAGTARLSEAAEKQAAANRFDEAGKSLLDTVGKLADALAAMR
jgi:hypothetical protein